MKAEINVSPEQLAKGMSVNDLVDFLWSFDDDNFIMDAVLKIEEDGGDWIILERMVQHLIKCVPETDLETGLRLGYISKSTFDALKKIAK